MTHNCYCGTPAPNAWLCKTHDRELEQLVTELPAMVGYLNDTISRQVRFSGGRIGGRPAETPVVFNDTASKVAREVKARLVAVVRSLVEDRGVSPHRLPSDDLLAIAQWLTRHLESIRLDEGAADYLADLRSVTRRIARAIDRPADTAYVGLCSIPGDSTSACPCICHTSGGANRRPCDVVGGCHTHHQTADCPQPLYAVPGAPFVRCPLCGYQHDARSRQGVLQEVARDTLMTIPELKVALPEVLGVPINHNTLRSWKRRKRITPHGELEGQELYRIGDILDLVVQQSSEESEAS